VGSDDCEVESGLSGEGKVNSGGRTTWLWIKRVSGFTVICSELWLIFGFSGIRFGLPAGFLRVRAPETMCFCRKNVDKLW